MHTWGVYPSHQASPTEVTYEDIDTCGDTLINPDSFATRPIADFAVDTGASFSFNDVGVDWVKSNDLMSICLRSGHDAENQEIINYDSSYWRSSGLVVYGIGNNLPEFRPYLEVTYTVPDTVNTVAEEVGLLGGLIEKVTNKAVKNSYTANFKNVLSFFDTEKYQAALNQLSALFKKVEKDAEREKIESAIAIEITQAVTSVEQRIEAVVPVRKAEVPLITQGPSPYPPESASWAETVYADGRANYPTSCGVTIRQCGCALASFAMLGQFYGMKTGVDGTPALPPGMNAWLLANNGYDPKGMINWVQAVKYFGNPAVPESSYFTYNANVTKETNTQLVQAAVDEHLKKVGPVIIKTKATNRDGKQYDHFILGTELTAGAYSVRDPLWYNTLVLDDVRDRVDWVQDYNDVINGGRLFTFNKNAKVAARAIEVHLASPAELLLTDSSGRRLGYDPVTETRYEEIPGGAYYKEEAVYSEELAASDVTPHVTKILTVLVPEDDVYTLEVVGTGVGEYTLSVVTIGSGGVDTQSAVVANTAVGERDAFVLDVETDNGEISNIISRIRALVANTDTTYDWLLRRLAVLEDKVEKENIVAADVQVGALIAKGIKEGLSDTELLTELQVLQSALGE